MQPAVEILFEDNHLLVVNKPAGLATMGSGEAPSLHRWACDYIRQRYNKPGKVYLGIVHRLDAMTSGVLVLARTSKAAARLSEQFRQRNAGPEKTYLAVVAGHVTPLTGRLHDQIFKDEAAHRMRLLNRSSARPGSVTGFGQPAKSEAAAEAILDYYVLRQSEIDSVRDRRSSAYTLVAVQLKTGRKHQIRVQFADRGHVVWGDAKYGDRNHRMQDRDGNGIALHAASLSIVHPVSKQRLQFRCQPPTSWGKFRPTAHEWETAFSSWPPVPDSPASRSEVRK